MTHPSKGGLRIAVAAVALALATPVGIAVAQTEAPTGRSIVDPVTGDTLKRTPVPAPAVVDPITDAPTNALETSRERVRDLGSERDSLSENTYRRTPVAEGEDESRDNRHVPPVGIDDGRRTGAPDTLIGR